MAHLTSHLALTQRRDGFAAFSRLVELLLRDGPQFRRHRDDAHRVAVEAARARILGASNREGAPTRLPRCRLFVP